MIQVIVEIPGVDIGINRHGSIGHIVTYSVTSFNKESWILKNRVIYSLGLHFLELYLNNSPVHFYNIQYDNFLQEIKYKNIN